MGNGDPGLIGRPGGGSGTAPGIGRQAAQRLAREELSKAIYHPHVSFFQWLAGKAGNLLSRLFSGAGAVIPGGWWTLVALAALVVVLAAVILRRIGPVARSRRGRPGLSESTLLTAREHRDTAERAAAAGDYAAAILEYLRAIAAGLEERGVLAPDPGRTADEFAGQAGRLLPAHAAGLTSAARLFDDVRYGGQPGTRTGCERLRDLETAIAATAPRPAVPA
ncbi:MAG: DUF4129 domain-containing protein [Streptosporangiaceae bacterium]|jgi:hypothetical protein